MNKRIRTNRLHRYILASGLIMVSFGIWISCSKDTGVSSIDPQPLATKPAVVSEPVDFHPQTGVNYDPFNGMNEEDRKNAIGGREAAEKYLRVIVANLARAMQNDQARQILQNVVPKTSDGEIHLAKIAAEYPGLLNALSGGFKDAVNEKNPGGALHLETQNTPSNGEAILKVSKALCDLVLTVVTTDGQKWDPDTAIPVFFNPLTDEDVTTVMEGVDTGLKAVTVPFVGEKNTPVFLLVNIDESSPMLDGNAASISMIPSKEGMWVNIFNAFKSMGLTSPAYAHDTNWSHGPHYYLIQPIRKIIIYDTHEGSTKPDIKMDVIIKIKDIPNSNDDVYDEEDFDLRDVDYINIPYTDYEDETTRHGVAESPNGNTITRIRVYETDGLWNADDEVCTWVDVRIVTPGSTLPLSRWDGIVGYNEEGQPYHRDADLWIKKLP